MDSLPGPVLAALEALDLPAPPSAVLSFLRTVAREDVSIDELFELVRREPALTARILEVANSAAFQGRGAMHDLRQCLQVLGVRTLHSIAASIAVREALAALPGSRSAGFDGFWRHALVTAEMAQSIAEETRSAEPEEAYLAGLLHDVGELLLLGGLADQYGPLLVQARDDERTLLALEGAALSTDHAAVGAWLVGRWQLPSFLADALLLHHRSLAEAQQADPLSRVLWAAHQGLSPVADGAAPAEAFDIAGASAGLSAERVAALAQAARDRVERLAGGLGLPAVEEPACLLRWMPPPSQSADAATQPLRETLGAMASLQPLHHELAAADSEARLLLAARESARIVFGVRDAVFLMRHGSEPVLVALPLAGQPAHLQRLKLDVQGPAAGVCGRAAREHQITSTFEDGASQPVSVADLQLARALGADGLLCVPMSPGAVVLGVMVFPLSRALAERLQPRAAMLASFAELLGGHLQSWHALRERERELQGATTEGLRLRERQVMHEVGNPLGIIKTYLTLVRRKLPEGAALGDELQVLHEEIDRVGRIVRQLDEAPSESSAAAGTLDVNPLLEGLRGLYSESLFGRAGIELVLELQRPLAATEADRDSLRQIVLNLWKNAAEALPRGARVTTSTADHIHRGGRVYTQLTVADDGPGLPADVTAALFRPLGRGRRAGHSGLGLSIVHGLVQRMGGDIICQSHPGRGTRFVILLPQYTTQPVQAPVLRSTSR